MLRISQSTYLQTFGRFGFLRKNRIFEIFDFLIFHRRKRFFLQEKSKTIKNLPFSPEAPNTVKIKGLGKVLRPKS